MARILVWFCALSVCPCWSLIAHGQSEANDPAYRALVAADQPAVHWDMNSDPFAQAPGGQSALKVRRVGALQYPVSGPPADRYPVFDGPQKALGWPGDRGYLVVDDPGENSVLDFDNGDALTIEAWVQVRSLVNGKHAYIIGKGRTNNPGVAADNQNYALRLTGHDGEGCPSFLFRSRGDGAEFHRWTAKEGIPTGSRWHHVAVAYRFGDPESLRCVVDGEEVSGVWDMGGATQEPPVVDNDELWIGSSVGGHANVTLHGAIAQLALFRKQLPVEELQRRFAKTDFAVDWKAPFATVPSNKVSVEVFANSLAGVPDLDDEMEPPRVSFERPWFAATALPHQYIAGGLRGKLGSSQLVRMRGRLITDAPERWELLIRTRSGSRLWVDGKKVADVPMMKRNSSGHESVPALAETEGQLAALSAGHQELRVNLELSPGEHLLQWDLVAGGKGVRTELGEAYIAARRADSKEVFRLLTATGLGEPVTEAYRTELLEAIRLQDAEVNAESRQIASEVIRPYWQRRHDQAAAVAARQRPPVPKETPGFPANNELDHFLNATIHAADVKPADLPPLLDGAKFLRRLTLDVAGVIPTAAELAAFEQDSVEGRRQRAIDRLLEDPRWADHWVSYWQDVLAENPGILKPKLNNTGPFRFWIHESFLDNKPLDRFATELIRMRGGVYEGGAAAFGVATQNDVPMAAKAHVIATAFLGVEMKCARCHDAPYHPYRQEELMGLAAYLQRQPIKLPASSTVPENPGGRTPLVEISLKPGAVISPQWPFPQWVSVEQVQPMLPAGADSRDELAALVTSPHNLRFAQVAVNRLWHRYFGRGLMPALGDWHEAETQHQDLLDYLACELMASGYDVKHVGRLILNSQAYQRQLDPNVSNEQLDLFVAPSRRRMSAEQLLDSLLTAAGKRIDTEALTLDPEGRRAASTFLNLGEPRRAWEFTSLSNERDRPALALPAAQSMVDLLVAFGWRESRPNPISTRSNEPTVRQPLALANGLASMKATRLSDDHVVTEMAVSKVPLEKLIRDVFLQVLSRQPRPAELSQFEELLRPGFEQRVIPGAEKKPRQRLRNPVSWSNHLNHEATRIKLELERRVRQGDPPTERLDADWRERLEDMLWALVNSPEFLFVP